MNGAMEGEVLAVCVGRPQQMERRDGRTFTSAINKAPVAGRIRAAGINLEGDDQADRTVHGGPDKAVYAYAQEDRDWWGAELGAPLAPGAFGENLVVAGLDVTGARIGERWRVGEALLEIRQPRVPCFKLGVKMGPTFMRRFAHAGRPGAYLSVVEPGLLGAGDRIEVVSRPDHDVSIGRVAHAFLHDRDALGDLLAAPALPDDWRGWIEARLSVGAS